MWGLPVSHAEMYLLCICLLRVLGLQTYDEGIPFVNYGMWALSCQGGHSSVVERMLRMYEVLGSIPSVSINGCVCLGLGLQLSYL